MDLLEYFQVLVALPFVVLMSMNIFLIEFLHALWHFQTFPELSNIVKNLLVYFISLSNTHCAFDRTQI